MSDTKIPVMFRGSKRLYRVVGVQGETIYGLNIDIVKKSKLVVMEMAWACLKDLPENSPFNVRAKGPFFVAFEDPPVGETPQVKGCRLDVLEVPIGKNLSSFDISKQVEKHLPKLQKWLDETLEAAAVVPTFNNSVDIFAKFFGMEAYEPEFSEFEIPAIGKYKGEVQDLDFSKYNEAPDDDEPLGTNHEDGEI